MIDSSPLKKLYTDEKQKKRFLQPANHNGKLNLLSRTGTAKR